MSWLSSNWVQSSIPLGSDDGIVGISIWCDMTISYFYGRTFEVVSEIILSPSNVSISFIAFWSLVKGRKDPLWEDFIWLSDSNQGKSLWSWRLLAPPLPTFWNFRCPGSVVKDWHWRTFTRGGGWWCAGLSLFLELILFRFKGGHSPSRIWKRILAPLKSDQLLKAWRPLIFL
jgi:hypothetical protein